MPRNMSTCLISDNFFYALYMETNNFINKYKLTIGRNSLQTILRCSYNFHIARVIFVSIDVNICSIFGKIHKTVQEKQIV